MSESLDLTSACVLFAIAVLGGAPSAHGERVGVEPGPAAPTAPPPLTDRGLANVAAAARLVSYLRFFHPSDQCVGVASWDHVAVALIEVAEPARDANDLATRLGEAIHPLAPTVRIWSGGVDDGPGDVPDPVADGATELVFWLHRGAGTIGLMRQQSAYRSVVERCPIDAPPPDVDLSPVTVALGGGVSISLPIAVRATADGTLPTGATPARWASADGLPRLTTADRSTRLASVALCWGIFQHFSPYLDLAQERWGVDWDETLLTALRNAAAAPDAKAHTDVLRSLVATMHDGHGGVFNPTLPPSTFLPLALEWAGDDLVVVTTSDEVSTLVNVGDAVVAVDGRPIAECCDEIATRISSATDGWRRAMIAVALIRDFATANPAQITLRALDGTERQVELRRAASPVMPRRTVGHVGNGETIGDPADRIVYFDLRGTKIDELIGKIVELARARAIVFDLRGYPDNAAYRLMGHLIAEPAQSAHWLIPTVRRPDREGWIDEESGRWRLAPLDPRLDQPIAFLTDGNAISYAESIMGIVEHYGLGEIVGAPTAGTNGNINPFELPGGDRVTWTGMKVLKHDGSRHHGIGILPTVPVEPTRRGIADGRDEVLEKAVEVLKAKLGAASAP